jgi:hypothetical protein
MYSFAQRQDTRVKDEPLFGHFLQHTGASRPSREEVLASMPTSPQEAIASMAKRPEDPAILFLKHMANHTEGLAWNDLDGPHHRHVLLTRHPDGVLPSYTAHVAKPSLLDLGYEHQTEILQLAPERTAVVTAESLHAEPEAVLKKLCHWAEIPWDPAMLHWPSGPRPEDGVWAPYWYQGVHASEGWESRILNTGNVPASLHPVREQSLGLYHALAAHAIQP